MARWLRLQLRVHRCIQGSLPLHGQVTCDNIDNFLCNRIVFPNKILKCKKMKQKAIIMSSHRCPRYGTIPAECHLVPDANDQCCQKPECNPTGAGACRDVKPDCASYGDYACHEPYAGWAKDNCAKFCGFCGNTTTSSIYIYSYF